MSHTLSVSTPDRSLDQTIRLLDRLFPPPRTFTIRLWNGLSLPAAGSSTFGLTLNHPGALRQMFRPPVELSLGEAYIHRDFDVDGDFIAALGLHELIFKRALTAAEWINLGRDWLALPDARLNRSGGRGPARMRGAVHSRERDRAAIQYHYNVGNEFYALWLDRRLQYSCAYFPTGTEDLDTAQERKLDHICRKLRLQPDERLLDIGCGWGGLLLFAAERYGVRAVGVTLSDRQAEYAQAWIQQSGLTDRVEVRLQDYRDLQGESFDKIVSVGMFEHVGRSHLPDYFAQARRLLKDGGLFLNHGIASWPGVDGGRGAKVGLRQRLERRIMGEGMFSQRYIFPDGELEPVSEVNLTAERAGFEVRDVENLREHYALTLRHWLRRLEQNRAQAISLTDEVTYRTWRLFLAASAYGFDTGQTTVNQTLLSKTVRGRAGVPLTRADLYTHA